MADQGLVDIPSFKQRIGLFHNGNPILAAYFKVYQFLNGTQTTGQSSAQQTIELSGEIVEGQNSEAGFSQTVSGVMTLSASSKRSDVQFTQEVSGVQTTTVKSCSNNLDLTQAIGGDSSLVAVESRQILNCSDEATPDREQDSGVAFGQTVSYVLQNVRGPVGRLKLAQSLFAFIMRNGVRIAIDSALNEITYVKTKTITLEFDAESLTLKAPELGNTDSLDLSTFVRLDSQNRRAVRSDASRPEVYTLSYEIDVCHLDALITFESNTRGQLVTLTDYMGRQWQGIVILAPREYVRNGENISLTFVGRAI